MTWQEFQKWQRWDEFPERVDNPPLTTSVCFWYKNQTYYIDRENGKMQLFNAQWITLASNENLLALCEMPIDEWDNKTFKMIIDESIVDA